MKNITHPNHFPNNKRRGLKLKSTKYGLTLGGLGWRNHEGITSICVAPMNLNISLRKYIWNYMDDENVNDHDENDEDDDDDDDDNVNYGDENDDDENENDENDDD
jgi:hypothetical protein